MLELFMSAAALGLLFNATPGAIFAESLKRGISGGFAPAFRVQIGSLVGDISWAVLGLGGAAVIFTLPLVDAPMSLAGAFLLLWLARQSLRDGLSPMPQVNLENLGQRDKSDYSVGAALSLSNPQNITYWAGLGGTITALGVDQPGWTAFLVFLAGFMFSSVAWCFVCAGFIARTRRFVGHKAWAAINIGCAVGLAAFGVLIVFRVLSDWGISLPWL